MKKPEIINFFKKGATLAYVHEIYKLNPELWAYIQAQDKHINFLTEKIKEAYTDGFSDSTYDFDLENYIDESK
jgi:hypothetical protein